MRTQNAAMEASRYSEGSLPRESSAAPERTQAFARLMHDARNLLAALSLYCDLLEEPGVLAAPHRHLAGDLRAVARTNGMLLDRLCAGNPEGGALAGESRGAAPEAKHELAPAPAALAVVGGTEAGDGHLEDDLAIHDLARELLLSRGLLAAFAGPSIALHLECKPCAGPLRLGVNALTRILLNLLRNAAEAMPRGGRVAVSTRPLDTRGVLLAVEDNGPGIPAEVLGRVFDAGVPLRRSARGRGHGYGLAIVRELAEAAGGTARVASSPGCGARFEIELPFAVDTTPVERASSPLQEGSCIQC